MSLLVKICGLSTRETLDTALGAGADMVGFVFFPPSPRHLSLETARELGRQAKGRAAKVALTVDADDATLENIVETLRPDLLQLHGKETIARVRDIKAKFALPVMKVIAVETSADLAVSYYRERFSDIGLYENGVYDGIGDVLTSLCASGHRLFVATSKPHVFAERIIDHFGLRDHFERVFGSELDGTRVDKSHLLEYALKQASVDPSKTLMIGDRSHDMVGAKNNGMQGIGVLYGYGSRDELLEAGAQHVCATPQAILGCIS